MKTLKSLLAILGLCFILYGIFSGIRYWYFLKSYHHNRCAAIEAGMTLDEVASLYDKTYYQLLEECQIRLHSQGNENEMLIIMPASPLASTPPTISLNLRSMTVSNVTCSDH